MAERLIHLEDIGTTEELRDAACTLTYSNLKLVNFWKDRLQQIPPFFTLRSERIKIGEVLQAKTTAFQNIQKEWDNAEIWVFRFMHQTKIFAKSPQWVDWQLREYLEAIRKFAHTTDAINFLENNEIRLNYLLSQDAFSRLGTLGLLRYSFVESRVLRRAVIDGVYLMQPQKS